jgi:hypothetical protein
MKQINIDNDEAIARILQEEEDNMDFDSSLYSQVEKGLQIDLIGSTLQKCDGIAASLRKELMVRDSTVASGALGMNLYAKTDASAAKIVSQVCQSNCI